MIKFPNWKLQKITHIPPVCVCMCFFRLKSKVKLLSQILHANGRTPWWTASLCTFKMDALVNDFSHSSQGWGRSPEWARRCLLSPDAFEKLLSQTLQIFDRTPWWMACLCCSRRYEWIYDFSHWSHANDRTPSCTVFLCIDRFVAEANNLLHISQVNDFSPN